MDINVTNITYALSNEETISVTVTLYGSDTNGNYINSTIKLTDSDLATGKTFGELTQDELMLLAKTKLATYTSIETSETSTATSEVTPSTSSTESTSETTTA